MKEGALLPARLTRLSGGRRPTEITGPFNRRCFLPWTMEIWPPYNRPYFVSAAGERSGPCCPRYFLRPSAENMPGCNWPCFLWRPTEIRASYCRRYFLPTPAERRPPSRAPFPWRCHAPVTTCQYSQFCPCHGGYSSVCFADIY